MNKGLAALAAALDAEGGLLQEALVVPTPGSSDQGLADDEFVTDAVREGYLLHYGSSRLLQDEDRDFALLAGDHCYSIGLSRLAELGDLPAIRRFAALIADGAHAQAAGDRHAAEALWEPFLSPISGSRW